MELHKTLSDQQPEGQEASDFVVLVQDKEVWYMRILEPLSGWP